MPIPRAVARFSKHILNRGMVRLGGLGPLVELEHRAARMPAAPRHALPRAGVTEFVELDVVAEVPFAGRG